MKMNRNWSNIKKLLSAVAKNHLYPSILITQSKHYCTDHLNLPELTPPMVLQVLRRSSIVKKSEVINEDSKISESVKPVWGHCEFKIFAWISVSYAFLQ